MENNILGIRSLSYVEDKGTFAEAILGGTFTTLSVYMDDLVAYDAELAQEWLDLMNKVVEIVDKKLALDLDAARAVAAKPVSNAGYVTPSEEKRVLDGETVLDG